MGVSAPPQLGPALTLHYWLSIELYIYGSLPYSENVQSLVAHTTQGGKHYQRPIPLRVGPRFGKADDLNIL